jgi:hypothetical protein
MDAPDSPLIQSGKLRRYLGMILTAAGLALFTLGAKPGWFGLDGSEAIGFVQIGVFSFGLFVLSLGVVLSLDSLWPNGSRSIIADLGIRMVWTGYVFALFSATADLIGLGTRQFPYFLPFFGYWQASGVMAGEVMILTGALMMIPYKRIFLKKKDLEK